MIGIQQAAGLTGSRRWDGTTPLTGQFYALAANEANVIVTEVLDENGANITADLGLGAGKPLNPGNAITVAVGRHMSKITLSAGSIVVYNK